MAENVTPLRMTADLMLSRIREFASVSANVFFTRHARDQMLKRKISPIQVFDVLLKGAIIEGPALNIRGNWQCTMRRFTAGTELQVVVVLEDGLLVITVY